MPVADAARIVQRSVGIADTARSVQRSVGIADAARIVQRSVGTSDFLFRCGFGIIGLLKWVSIIPRKQRWRSGCADVAQSAEHPPCKRAVTSSILVVGFARKRQE